ncbi:hypothetical protein BIT28_11100 [Photobacterium proteolyticum]|uniref:DUF3306 domain-containing protein n=1 Tax=Photobacterium proteolyticum TaxID=1903952 RepID=A0A1Q9G711_9GAMM|nr:DUF3306 domain-containing protein [Photobacterium proteolyticum]OLQ70072.1 hypothetical protein BIT28_11100 [Photobacterium proteolyticum]
MATNFFQRWSSRKLASCEAAVEKEDAVESDADSFLSEDTASLSQVTEATDKSSPEVDSCAGANPSKDGDEESGAEVLTLKDVANVTFDGGVTSFMRTGVDKSVKKAALRKLFHSDEFNYVSDMDDHTEDFSNVPTLDSGVTKQLRNWVNQASEKLEEVSEQLDASEQLDQTASDDCEATNSAIADHQAFSKPAESTAFVSQETPVQAASIQDAPSPTLSEEVSFDESGASDEHLASS